MGDEGRKATWMRRPVNCALEDGEHCQEVKMKGRGQRLSSKDYLAKWFWWKNLKHLKA